MRIFLHDIAAVSLGLSISGHGAGVRAGDWSLQMVESADVRDDGWLSLDGLREVEVARSTAVERHLLRPYDLLVTARSDSHQVAMVPPGVNRTVAGVTLLVIRPHDSARGMAPLAVLLPLLSLGPAGNRPAEAGQFVHQVPVGESHR